MPTRFLPPPHPHLYLIPELHSAQHPALLRGSNGHGGTVWLARHQGGNIRSPLLSKSFPIHQNSFTLTQAQHSLVYRQFGKNLDLLGNPVPQSILPAATSEAVHDCGDGATCPVLPKICFSLWRCNSCPLLTGSPCTSKRSRKGKLILKDVLFQLTQV